MLRYRYFRKLKPILLFFCAVAVLLPFLNSSKLQAYKIYQLNSYSDTPPSLASRLFNYTRTPNISVACPRLLLLIFSAPKEKERRAAIRATWGHSTRLEPSRAALVFVIGSSSFSKELDAEQRDYGDILTDGRLIDNYNNLTRKVVSALYWASTQSWQQLRYIAKIDSDNFVNVNVLSRIAQKAWNSVGSLWMTGYIISGKGPYRNKGNKWYVSEKEFPGQFYPSYLNGPHYMMTLEAARRETGNQTLVEVVSGKSLRMEDVYVTGIVRARLGIPLVQNGNLFIPHMPNMRRFLNETVPVFAAVHSLRGNTDHARFQEKIDEPNTRLKYYKLGFG